MTSYISAHTVLTLPRLVVICSVTFILTLERSHTLAQYVGGAFRWIQVEIDICRKYILQLISSAHILRKLQPHLEVQCQLSHSWRQALVMFGCGHCSHHYISLHLYNLLITIVETLTCPSSSYHTTSVASYPVPFSVKEPGYEANHISWFNVLLSIIQFLHTMMWLSLPYGYPDYWSVESLSI